MKYDCIIIGAGLAGAVIARKLAEHGLRVHILDKRNHIAGNLFDEIDDTGILVQKYGPHIFHTNNDAVMNFVSKYATWSNYKLKCKVFMNNKLTPSPFNFKTIDDFYLPDQGKALKKALKDEFPNQEVITITELLDNENEIIREFAEFLYDNDYRPYTAKQWGISPEKIDKSVLQRVPILLSYKEEYYHDKYEVMPEKGFTEFIKNILNHINISISLNEDAKSVLHIKNNEFYFDNELLNIPVVYTGALDNLFDFAYGLLPYRTLQFVYEIHNVDSYQEAPVIAYPQEESYTRITEYKKLPVQNIKDKSIIVKEYPIQYAIGINNEPYYPINNNENNKLYNKYKKLADMIPKLYLCGRLAEYKYYYMDEVVNKALIVADKIIEEGSKNNETTYYNSGANL